MIRLLVWLALAALAATLADWLGRRLSARGECGLHRALILPDSCQGRCPPGQRCVAFNAKRHWLFGRQAAGCGCIAGRFGGTPVEPPDFADPPRRPGPREDAPDPGRPPEPAGPPAPEETDSPGR